MRKLLIAALGCDLEMFDERLWSRAIAIGLANLKDSQGWSCNRTLDGSSVAVLGCRYRLRACAASHPSRRYPATSTQQCA